MAYSSVRATLGGKDVRKTTRQVKKHSAAPQGPKVRRRKVRVRGIRPPKGDPSTIGSGPPPRGGPAKRAWAEAREYPGAPVRQRATLIRSLLRELKGPKYSRAVRTWNALPDGVKMTFARPAQRALGAKGHVFEDGSIGNLEKHQRPSKDYFL